MPCRSDFAAKLHPNQLVLLLVCHDVQHVKIGITHLKQSCELSQCSWTLAYAASSSAACMCAHLLLPRPEAPNAKLGQAFKPISCMCAQVPLGHTIIRRQLLRAKGWTVMSVPSHEWCRISHSWKLRKEYIRQLIRLHACQRTSTQEPDLVSMERS